MGARLRTRWVSVVLALLFALPSDHGALAARGVPEARNKPAQSLAIVVNPSNPVQNLSFGELRKIFLGERSAWPHGRKIALAMLDYGWPERQSVLRQIYRMNEDGYDDHFAKGVFRGEIFVAPKALASPEIMRKFVFNAPGGIGYLRTSDVDDSVKVLRIDGRLPTDKDYRLQIDEASEE